LSLISAKICAPYFLVAASPGSARFTWNTTSADMISGIFTSAGSPVTLGAGDLIYLRP
jgi:hypothetical protein